MAAVACILVQLRAQRAERRAKELKVLFINYCMLSKWSMLSCIPTVFAMAAQDGCCRV